MSNEDDLLAFLPSRQTELLAQALARRLVDVDRFFSLSPEEFGTDPRWQRSDFFGCNSGPVQLTFEQDVRHVLDVWGEQLSLIVQTEPLAAENMFGRLYPLSADAAAPPWLRACLGRECVDVRIWTLHEEIESSEAKEAGVSYALAGGPELFYCIYLHDDLSSDYLLPGADVPRHKVERCYSIAKGGYVDPRP